MSKDRMGCNMQEVIFYCNEQNKQTRHSNARYGGWLVLIYVF